MARKRTSDGVSDDDKIVHEAQQRFDRTSTWESTARTRFIEDVRFANGDSDNLYQWPLAVRNNRGMGTNDERPCLTINKTQQHCLQIINDARQNKASIKIKPIGSEATYEAAQVYEGILRHIEYVSDAQSAYMTATRFQVEGGIGYFRIVTDYIDDDSFDQDIFIRRVKDPLTVYIDPDIQEADGSDMRFAFVYEDVPRDEFDRDYPKFKDRVGTSALGDTNGKWIDKDHIRVAEYYRKKETSDRLLVITDPESGARQEIRASQLSKEVLDAIPDDQVQSRDITVTTIEWFKIAGDQIVDRRILKGKYIPICRVPGSETVIDGQLDRKGHVRSLKDPQRMYNYNASAEVEFGALQSKTPYIAPAEAIEGYETYWETANTENHSILPYKGLNEQGQQIAAPQRQQPPVSAPVFLDGMRQSAEDMMMVSGQYQANFGEQGNERSGIAIQERQRQGDNATYHFIDHLAMAIRYAGRIIVDLIPHIYDTPRVMKMLAEDGEESEVLIDPDARQAYQEQKARNTEAAKQIVINPKVGKYWVEVDVGPAFATRRQEAFNALGQIAAQNPQLMSIIGDLVLSAADFPLADSAAQRLRRMVPPQAMGEGPTPEMQQAMQQNQHLQMMLSQLSQKLAESEMKLKDKSEGHGLEQQQKLIDAHKAETARFTSLQKAFGEDPEGVQAVLRQAVSEALGMALSGNGLPQAGLALNPPEAQAA